nr:MAG TPA: hypothetical protein [Caudoviricetes sp.]
MVWIDGRIYCEFDSHDFRYAHKTVQYSSRQGKPALTFFDAHLQARL